MWQVLTPIVALGLMLAVPAAYDIVLVAMEKQTISGLYRDLGHTWSPLLIYAVSLLPGHWWVNFEQSVIERLDGGWAGELFVICWIGWGIHWGFRAYPEATPLGPWGALTLIYASVLVGGCFWTLSPAS